MWLFAAVKLADSDGRRPVGVLTKPDLATETATRNAVMDLPVGKGATSSLDTLLKRIAARMQHI